MNNASVGFNEILKTVREIDPANDKLFSMDDIGNGKLFSVVFGRVWLYNTTAKEPYIYDGRVWKRDAESMITSNLAKKLSKALFIYSADFEKPYRDFVGKLGDQRKRQIMIKDARDFCFASDEDFDKKPDFLNCQNGTLDLKTFELRPHKPEDMITKIANVEYNPKVKSESWERFVYQVMEGNEGKIDYLRRVCGYGILGSCIEDEFYLFYGATTRNGKTTFLNAVGYILGDYGQLLSPDALAERQRNSRNASEEIVDLKGARFIHIEEPSKQMILDSALVKNLTGHAPIRARRMYERNQTFEPEFKIYIASNYLPTVTDDTLFSSDRVKVIKFDRHFEPKEQDKGLKERFRTAENASGILTWLCEGLRDYYERGTEAPKEVTDASTEYRQESDKFGNWVSDSLEEDRASIVKVKDLYEDYQEWNRNNGYMCENLKNFTQNLKRKRMWSATGTVFGKTVKNVVKGFRLINTEYANMRNSDYIPE